LVEIDADFKLGQGNGRDWPTAWMMRPPFGSPSFQQALRLSNQLSQQPSSQPQIPSNRFMAQ